jgi:hypothetical protein
MYSYSIFVQQMKRTWHELFLTYNVHVYVYLYYPAISTFAVQICYTNTFLLYSYKKDRNKGHSSPFINVVKGVFFVDRVTLVPVSYLSALSISILE